MARYRGTSLLSAITALAAALGAMPLAAQAGEAAAPAGWISQWIREVLQTGATPALAVAVVQGDSIIYARASGVADLATGQPATDSTRFYVASTTKAFTALAAAVLDQRGRLPLGASLRDVFPELALHDSLSPASISMRDLLALRSGIGDGPVIVRTAYTGEFTTPVLISLLRTHGPAPAGRAFYYSNVGYNIYGMALERRLGRPWQDVVAETVLTPLGMHGTTARVSSLPGYRLAMPHEFVRGELARAPLQKSDQTMHAAGGHVTTAGDLARFLLAQLNEGRVRGQPGVPAAAVSETHRLNTPQNRQFSFVRRTGWGLGWDIGEYDGNLLLQRNGGFRGYYSHVSFLPGRELGVAVLANGGLDGDAAETLARGIYDVLLGRLDRSALAARRDSLAASVARARQPRSDAARTPLPGQPSRYFGRFTNDVLGTLELEGNDEVLLVRMGDSWDFASGVPGPDGKPLPDALAAGVLGGAQRFTVRFGADGRAEELTVRRFAFRRAGAP